jgi:hypothetical protein
MDDNNKKNIQVVSTGEWLIVKFILLIPIINIIFLIILSLSRNENQNKINWARATLFIYLIRLCFAIVIVLTFLSFFINLFNF